MELHKALQYIIQTEGRDIIKEIRLVNILDDFNAYQDIPASKYILRAIIAEEYTNKLLALGKWDNRAEILSQKFSAMTGFIPESVSAIFQSIAYGLGWINTYSPILQASSYSPVNLQPSLISNSDFAQLTVSKQEDYLSGLIQIDANIESNLGIIINANISIKAPTLYLNVEASGKLKQKFSTSIFVSVYNKVNQMKGLKKVMIFDNHPVLSSICCSSIFFDGFLKNRNYSEKCYEFNISKIRIYAERDLY